MRIGLLIYDDINTISGGYLYNRKVVEFLCQNGDEVTVISIKRKSYFKSLFSNSFPEELNKITLDVLIQDELIHPSFWLINKRLKQIVRCPIVSLVHLFNSARPVPPHKRYFSRYIEKKYLESVDALILNSLETLSQANSLLNNNSLPTVVALPCGDNFSQVEQTNKSFNQPQLKILFVGNISTQKGLHTLIKALSVLDGNITLSVVGYVDEEMRYIKSIKKYIAISGLDQRIKFYGQLTGETLKEKYLEHDIFVLPSINEAYGIVFLEAMQFGLPVIGCKLGGAKEIIDDKVNGYLIDSDDDQRLADCIDGLFKDRELLQKMSESSIEKYLQHPRWDETSNKIKIFLRSLIDNKETRYGQ